MKEPFSFCVGCGNSFYLTDKSVKATIGSPEYDTICHKSCCGKSKECEMCSVYVQAHQNDKRVAVTNLINVLVVTIAALSDKHLNSLNDMSAVYITPLIQAELDKRNGNIKDYKIKVSPDTSLFMQIIKGDSDAVS